MEWTMKRPQSSGDFGYRSATVPETTVHVEITGDPLVPAEFGTPAAFVTFAGQEPVAIETLDGEFTVGPIV